MADPTPPPSEKITRRLLLERRTSVRFPSALTAQCRAEGGPADVFWPARVLDLSPKGVGLVIGREILPGTLLTVQFHQQTTGVILTAQVRVIYRRHGPLGWMHGCQFVRSLSEDELGGLLK